jgi:hypothetical protein
MHITGAMVGPFGACSGLATRTGSTIAPRQPARQSIGIERAMSLHDRSHEGAAPAAASAALGQRERVSSLYARSCHNANHYRR